MFSIDDYPLECRSRLYDVIEKYWAGEIDQSEVKQQIAETSISFYIDYSEEDDDQPLGSLSPFIIDIDDNNTIARIDAIYTFDELKADEMFSSCKGRYDQLLQARQKDMVESYIIAITNLTIMDSISVLTSIEEQYNNSWLRIIVALDALGFYKDMICNIPNFGKTIHRCRKYCYMKYRNYLEEMMCALQMLEAKFGDVLEKYPPFSKEWEEEKRTAISILASIK